jgi:hypothetical protein
MTMSVMATVHEEMHQRAGEDEKQRSNPRQMRAVPDEQIKSARGDKAKQEKPLRIGEAAKHLSPSFRGKAESGACAPDAANGLR